MHELGVRVKIMEMALNGSGVRDTPRVLGISPQTVMRERKEIEAVNQRALACLSYPPELGQALRLGADERWSFVRCKKGKRWLWWVEDAESGQVVDFVFGRRTHATFRRLLTVLQATSWAVEKRFTNVWGATRRVCQLSSYKLIKPRYNAQNASI